MTYFSELQAKVLLRLRRSDGLALIAARQSINDAYKAMARAQDFEDLMAVDTAYSVADQKSYGLESDWTLTRMKDIYSIRLIGGSSGDSVKLEYVPPQKLDRVMPYPEGAGTSKPFWYTIRGNNIELIPIPDDAYTFYVYYSQWPVILSSETLETDSPSLSDDYDDVVINLASEIAESQLVKDTGREATMTDWTQRAKEMLKGAVNEHRSRPDQRWVAQPFNTEGTVTGEYWRNPFVRSDP